ncbi:hypothetical protein CSA80_05150 [Candidatus Saccharibacteria bacterium]|nr:MAG: hypothetical protein CSA80_05150 [Candidatus Saccharibacteria bacterium]
MAVARSAKVFFDTTVLLESVQSGPQVKDADRILHAHAGRACTSALTVHFVMSLGLQLFSAQVLRQFLAEFSVISVGSNDVAWAFSNMKKNDFANALQLAAAIREGCEVFYTFDEGVYRLYRSLPHIRVTLLGQEKC